MDATIYSLADMRSRRDTATTIAKIYPMSMASAGLARPLIELTLHAASFWVEYAIAMQSFHARLLSSASWPSSQRPKIVARPSPW